MSTENKEKDQIEKLNQEIILWRKRHLSIFNPEMKPIKRLYELFLALPSDFILKDGIEDAFSKCIESLSEEEGG